MLTASRQANIASEQGKLNINGLNVNTLQVENFSKTLISYTDLADMGVTGKMNKDTIELFLNDKPWTTVTRGEGRLWHFTDVEAKYN